MDIPEYRNRGRRPLTLPSGLEGFVRAPNVMDLAAYPALLRASMRGEAGGEETLGEWIHCALRRCFLPARGVMCEKEPGRCLPGELSVHELEPADAAAILEAVAALGAGAGEGAAPGAPFPPAGGGGRGPGAAGAAGGAPPPGADLRPAAPPPGAV